jgi:hypothetical protein
MWMWFLVKISIYHTFIASLFKKLIFWYENSQISHLVSKHGSYYVKWHGSIYPQLSYRLKIILFLEYICVFEYIGTLHSFWQIHSNIPIYKLPRLYSNIIWKNIVKIFQKFEVGYTQTCTSLESSKMWHPKKDHCSVFSPMWLTI